MEFAWDEAKRRSNLAKHGLDFADLAEHFEWDDARYRDDFSREEPRTQVIGYLSDMVVVIVFTLRGDVCRIISVRKAEPKERRQYER